MRPVPEIIADREAAAKSLEEAQAAFKKFDAELMAVQNAITAALRPQSLKR